MTPFFIVCWLHSPSPSANRLMARQLTRKAENLFESKKYVTTTVAE
jgi:hypothetical protein